MVSGNDVEILNTNLQPFFWKKVKAIIRQNKKAALLQFLFGSQESIAETDSTKGLAEQLALLQEKIQTLQNEVNSLKEKVINLEANVDDSLFDFETKYENQINDFEENQTRNSNYLLRGQTNALESSKGDSTLKPMKGSNLTNSDQFKPRSESQKYNIPLEQKPVQNGANFKTLAKISEEEKIEIIKLGFQLN